jgi:hypothetical protein
MQPIVPNAGVGPAGEPGTVPLVPSSAPASLPERGHFVFGLFQEPPKADEALRKLSSGNFQDEQILLIRGSTAHQDGAGDGIGALPHGTIAAGTLFVPLLSMLQRTTADGHTHNSIVPRITDQITDYLGQGGAVLIVILRTAAQERLAARTLLTCKCDVLLTHEVATKV